MTEKEIIKEVLKRNGFGNLNPVQKEALKLGLLKRKTYDLQAAIELTQTLKTFDKNDPLKYDFALYRLGQEKIV